MAQLDIEVNGRPYAVGCEDGQEARLRGLAAMVDAQVRQASQDIGPLGEVRLMLMGALLLADELTDLRERLGGLETELAGVKRRLADQESAALVALENAAQRIEDLVGG